MFYVGDEAVIKVYQGSIELSGLSIGSDFVPVTSGDTPTYTPYVTVYFSNSSRTDYYPSGIIPDEQYRNEEGRLDDIIAVEIGSGITHIGISDYAYTFAGLSNMSSVTIGENVEYIGGRAFEDTGSLKAVTIPASVTGIGTNAFYNFDDTCTITFEGSVPSMSMSEEGDLGVGTRLIVPDAEFENYCSILGGFYCIMSAQDSGTTCGICGGGSTSAMPLTVRILSDRPDQYFVWGKTGWGVTAKAIRAKYNDDEPEELSGDRAMGYEVHAGDIIQFWGDNAAYGGTAGCHLLSGNCMFEIYGNLASLLNSTGFTEVDSIPNQYALARLFQGQTGLTAVRDLSIGDNILGGQLGSNFIYRLFQGCSNLNYIKIMLDGNIDSTYSKQITQGVSETGTFVKPSGATWETGVNGIPDGWTVIDADI